MNLGPEHPAYCIPFNIGSKMQVVVHMLLSPAQAWTDEQKQLAQTYVNTAASVLIYLYERHAGRDGRAWCPGPSRPFAHRWRLPRPGSGHATRQDRTTPPVRRSGVTGRGVRRR